MIKLNIFTLPNGDITGFRCTGHSGCGEAGKDIVCAAVSSAVYMTANTITDILHISAEIEVSDGNLLCRVFSKDAVICRDIFQGFKLHMCSLEEQYPQFIVVNYTEV